MEHRVAWLERVPRVKHKRFESIVNLKLSHLCFSWDGYV